MGFMSHNAIIVTSWSDEHTKQVHDKANEIFPEVSELMFTMNGNASFFIPPDGSKEGWRDSDEGDSRRAIFVSWLKDSGFYVDWVEVQYGNDNHYTKVVGFGPGGDEED